MKQMPREELIQDRLKSGAVTLDGFLGDDNRHYHDIIAEDIEKVKALGKTNEEIAARMQALTDKAFEFADEESTIDEIYRVRYQTERGKVMSPFMDNRFLPKGVVYLVNTSNNLSINWTPLNIYMIQKYGFYEGRGAVHRLEPELLIRAIF